MCPQLYVIILHATPIVSILHVCGCRTGRCRCSFVCLPGTNARTDAVCVRRMQYMSVCAHEDQDVRGIHAVLVFASGCFNNRVSVQAKLYTFGAMWIRRVQGTYVRAQLCHAPVASQIALHHHASAWPFHRQLFESSPSHSTLLCFPLPYIHARTPSHMMTQFPAANCCYRRYRFLKSYFLRS